MMSEIYGKYKLEGDAMLSVDKIGCLVMLRNEDKEIVTFFVKDIIFFNYLNKIGAVLSKVEEQQQ